MFQRSLVVTVRRGEKSCRAVESQIDHLLAFPGSYCRNRVERWCTVEVHIK
jgi:hypothetical protein